ncbi:adenosylmethionine--8-amino-7-oxononanoate transaminase [Flavobacterium sp. Fl-77]|uniref:Adenosylmethionine-8-amino-7-oxononanoate aminotransferase n=1 Tax=Flavobacterium flavipigmentatum TaxID=2893884 RepID=A0AAJ2S4M4_9FLAO|nr:MULTISPECIES: adenosylmethionine--8-amino-7-oxononanoate transaminase [unclassified Flavobacterium]MDX6180813.1 adenosylmethionine--8-amino-7-oxononanoate transaminase [Flavobacterium sp. Fl-33]MDX6184413.1 adenosylmethionine--8-amino-7-oxononanoate transaminase [Flavobacterium sp. Fl-77]UFH39522.1 adenosylmethionine--8-amino-7-oxononanoate transaminase [Flavobacterium sp. F-70]
MTLQEKDSQYLWHPYTQHKTAQTPIVISRGEGALLWDENNKEYIDAIASWWVNPFGHSNKFIADAIYKQLTTLEHVLFGGFTHEPAIKVAEKLLEILPKNQQKIFFSDNGSTAVEVAIKVALQYFFNKNEKRTTIIAFENAFHGDTFAAMAASGISFYTQAFQGMFIDVVRIPVPVKGQEKESFEALERVIKNHKCAGFIFEPLVQGAAGMVMYEPEALAKLITICRENNVLTIADEVMTGFGKTGKTFAMDYVSEEPDMICLSKALTGGTIPMAITTFTSAVFDAFYDDDINKALFHGHTFTGNPTGCAAALASIDLLQTTAMQDNIKRINTSHLLFQKKIEKHPKVITARTLGVVFAVEIKSDATESYYGSMRTKLYNFFIEKGVVLRPVGNIVYILPPYVMTEEQLQKVYATIEEAIEMV